MARLPESITRRLRLPLIAAPMLLVSGPDLVIAASRGGAIGSFPTKNCRTVDELEHWLARIQEETDGHAPFAPNLIVHKTNTRLAEDVKLVEKYKCAMVITSVGSPAPVMDTLHAAGTLVFADVASMRHVERALEVGVDGLILLTSRTASRFARRSRSVATSHTWVRASSRRRKAWLHRRTKPCSCRRHWTTSCCRVR
jgi:nitronate monooxygenase